MAARLEQSNVRSFHKQRPQILINTGATLCGVRGYIYPPVPRGVGAGGCSGALEHEDRV